MLSCIDTAAVSEESDEGEEETAASGNVLYMDRIND